MGGGARTHGKLGGNRVLGSARETLILSTIQQDFFSPSSEVRDIVGIIIGGIRNFGIYCMACKASCHSRITIICVCATDTECQWHGVCLCVWVVHATSIQGRQDVQR